MKYAANAAVSNRPLPTPIARSRRRRQAIDRDRGRLGSTCSGTLGGVPSAARDRTLRTTATCRPVDEAVAGCGETAASDSCGRPAPSDPCGEALPSGSCGEAPRCDSREAPAPANSCAELLPCEPGDDAVCCSPPEPPCVWCIWRTSRAVSSAESSARSSCRSAPSDNPVGFSMGVSPRRSSRLRRLESDSKIGLESSAIGPPGCVPVGFSAVGLRLRGATAATNSSITDTDAEPAVGVLRAPDCRRNSSSGSPEAALCVGAAESRNGVVDLPSAVCRQPVQIPSMIEIASSISRSRPHRSQMRGLNIVDRGSLLHSDGRPGRPLPAATPRPSGWSVGDCAMLAHGRGIFGLPSFHRRGASHNCNPDLDLTLPAIWIPDPGPVWANRDRA